MHIETHLHRTGRKQQAGAKFFWLERRENSTCLESRRLLRTFCSRQSFKSRFKLFADETFNVYFESLRCSVINCEVGNEQRIFAKRKFEFIFISCDTTATTRVALRLPLRNCLSRNINSTLAEVWTFLLELLSLVNSKSLLLAIPAAVCDGWNS